MLHSSEPITAFLARHPDPYQVIDLGKDLSAKLFKEDVIRDWPPELRDLLDSFRKIVERLLNAIPPKHLLLPCEMGQNPPPLQKLWYHTSKLHLRASTKVQADVLRRNFGVQFPNPPDLLKKYCTFEMGRGYILRVSQPECIVLNTAREVLLKILSAIQARLSEIKPDPKKVGKEKRDITLADKRRERMTLLGRGRIQTLRRHQARITVIDDALENVPMNQFQRKEFQEEKNRLQRECKGLEAGLREQG